MNAEVGGRLGVGVRVTVAVVTGFNVGDKVGIKVGTGASMLDTFSSDMESEKPPRIKPMETSAMITPWNTCQKFFISSSLRANLPRPASGR